MSTRTRDGFNPKRWVILILGACLLYVGTWPPIELLCTTEQIDVVTMYHGTKTFRVRSAPRPPWVDVVYRPLHRVKALNFRLNPVGAYFRWWSGKFQ